MEILMSKMFDVGLLTLLMVAALAAVLTRNLLTSTIILSVYSLLMASMYLVLGAPDVAMTEAAVGAGISTFLLLAVLLLTGIEEKPSPHPILPLFVIGITAAGLIYATLGMPAFGDANSPASQHVSPYFITESMNDIGIPNVVTSILASYRGFDTLGEVFVVFTAGISVLMLLGGKKEKQPK
ncbi:MAG: DUF4040 domain-containing protein [Alphaproteobacteria bacterium]|nr:DUF4040 domain-containing protein [Alphaproteobacteria bacterium]